ncbi:MAG: uncharacterized protein A8A55_0771 [Amphiamblys sp. WSBS2006]|nr:MAG: uncharacterized protein A8A55_0771 [Amphiamblys sp. WSBS2006]
MAEETNTREKIQQLEEQWSGINRQDFDPVLEGIRMAEEPEQKEKIERIRSMVEDTDRIATQIVNAEYGNLNASVSKLKEFVTNIHEAEKRVQHVTKIIKQLEKDILSVKKEKKKEQPAPKEKAQTVETVTSIYRKTLSSTQEAFRGRDNREVFTKFVEMFFSNLSREKGRLKTETASAELISIFEYYFFGHGITDIEEKIKKKIEEGVSYRPKTLFSFSFSSATDTAQSPNDEYRTNQLEEKMKMVITPDIYFCVLSYRRIYDFSGLQSSSAIFIQETLFKKFLPRFEAEVKNACRIATDSKTGFDIVTGVDTDKHTSVFFATVTDTVERTKEIVSLVKDSSIVLEEVLVNIFSNLVRRCAERLETVIRGKQSYHLLETEGLFGTGKIVELLRKQKRSLKKQELIEDTEDVFFLASFYKTLSMTVSALQKHLGSTQPPTESDGSPFSAPLLKQLKMFIENLEALSQKTLETLLVGIVSSVFYHIEIMFYEPTNASETTFRLNTVLRSTHSYCAEILAANTVSLLFDTIPRTISSILKEQDIALWSLSHSGSETVLESLRLVKAHLLGLVPTYSDIDGGVLYCKMCLMDGEEARKELGGNSGRFTEEETARIAQTISSVTGKEVSAEYLLGK